MRKDNFTDYSQSPVIIGGLGGSGTRVITDILSKAGIQFGSYLGPALDNLHFGYVTEPFRDSVLWPFRRMKHLIDVFIALQFRRRLSFSNALVLIRIGFYRSSLFNPVAGPFRHARYTWRIARRYQLPYPPKKPWGWKLPRNQLYLPALNQYFPKCRYIHIVRHGLDMAFSDNLTQLKYYGRFFGVDAHNTLASTPSKQLDYWIHTNQQVKKICAENLKERYLIINYNTLCANPVSTISQLLDFLSIPYTDSFVRHLGSQVNPTTINRYKSEDLAQFSPEQLLAVREMGFEI